MVKICSLQRKNMILIAILFFILSINSQVFGQESNDKESVGRLFAAHELAAQNSSSVPSECLLEAKSGPCEAAMIRYYYDSKTGKCTTFTYGGCEANGNNFKSLSECQQRCISSDAPKNESQVKAICQLKYDIGPCDAAILRYFYNTTSGKCEQFVYGGCAGNANNFNTLDECHKECINRQVTSKLRVENAAICTQEAAAGLCKANLVRYYFNATSEECQPFIYGGCGGNSNNFERTLDCQTTCTVTS